jgi:hypothetical protein
LEKKRAYTSAACAAWPELYVRGVALYPASFFDELLCLHESCRLHGPLEVANTGWKVHPSPMRSNRWSLLSLVFLFFGPVLKSASRQIRKTGGAAFTSASRPLRLKVSTVRREVATKGRSTPKTSSTAKTQDLHNSMD